MKRRIASSMAVTVLGILLSAGTSPAGYEVRVDLKNVSGQVKTDWPVILRVYTVFGRNLDPAAIHPAGYHVYDVQGKEVPHAIEPIPPYDQPGNDEIIFVIPRMEPDQVVSYRIANDSNRSSLRAKIDVVNSPHNLIANGDFEKADGDAPAGFTAPARLDAKTRHTGRSCLMLSADGKDVATRRAGKVPLHKGSWYYFGVWSKTQGVSRFGYQAGGGGYFRLMARDPESNKEISAFSGQVTPQCSTRDWLKVTLEHNGQTDWGTDVYAAKAVASEATVEFALRQRRHYYMTAGNTRGQWWLDGAVLMEQPEVNVRFDLSVEPLIEDGVFLFTRPPLMPLGRLDEKKRGRPEWCTRPFAHEKLVSLDRFALKGQRVSYCVGLYHTQPIKDVLVRLKGDALIGPGAASIPAELIEYCPGYLGPDRGRYMKVLNAEGGVQPVTPAGEEGVRYFFLTFNVPEDAKPGRYAGTVEVLREKAKLLRAVPLSLRVQGMVQPTPKDVFVGLIHQGGNPRWDDEALTVYSRSGFNCITRFGNFLEYEKDEDGKWQVNLDALHKQMMRMKKYGFAGVSIFSDLDVGPKWDGGRLLKLVRPADFKEGQRTWAERLETAAEAYKAQIRRIEAARRSHPEWPTLIYLHDLRRAEPPRRAQRQARAGHGLGQPGRPGRPDHAGRAVRPVAGLPEVVHRACLRRSGQLGRPGNLPVGQEARQVVRPA